MQRACLFAAILAILLSVGCSKKNAGLSGTYKRQPPLPAGDATMTFQEDGTFESAGPGNVVKGTYELKGRALSIAVTQVNGKPPQGKEAELPTATLSEDGKSFNLFGQDIEFIKQE